MANKGKTGGGAGTNQYQVRGTAQRRALTPQMTTAPTLNDLTAPQLHALAQQADCPPRVLEWLAGSNDDDIRANVAQHPRISPDTLEYLGQDPVVEVRRAVAQNPHTPSDTLEKMQGETDGYLLNLLARNPNGPLALFEQLAGRHNTGIDAALSMNPKMSPAILTSLADRIPERLRANLIANPACPPDILRRWAETPLTGISNELEFKKTIASHSNTPPDTLDALSRHMRQDLVAVVAANPHCLESTLRILADSYPPTVRQAVAGNPTTPADILAGWADDPLYKVQIAGNIGCPSDTLERLAFDHSSNIRAIVASNQGCPPAALIKLMESKNITIRDNARANPSVPDHVRAVMALGK